MSQFVKGKIDGGHEIYPVWNLKVLSELPEGWFDEPGKPGQGKPCPGSYTDIPVALVERYKSAQKEWEAVQAILSDSEQT